MPHFLINVEMVSSLKVNHEKCSVMGIDVVEEIIQNFTSILRCHVGKLPFHYLGVKVGSIHEKLQNGIKWSKR